MSLTNLCKYGGRRVPPVWIYIILILTLFAAKLILNDVGVHRLRQSSTETNNRSECELLIAEMSDLISSIVHPSDFFFDLNTKYRKGMATFRHKLQKIKDRQLFESTIMALLSNTSLNQRFVSRGTLGAILDRSDRSTFRLPSLMYMEPDSILPPTLISQLPTQVEKPPSEAECVLVDESTAATHNGLEDKLWYFRQDPLVNTHHLFWHAIYPHNAQLSPLDAGRRRGELFYFMHHDFLARYHAERLSNGLQPVTPFILEKSAIVEEAFETSLIQKTGVGKVHWMPRPHRQTIADSVEATFANLTISEALLWGRRIKDSIFRGELISVNGSTIPLLNLDGINWIVNTIEAVLSKSANSDYYGEFGYHNGGHVFIGNIMHPHDPQGTYALGPMTDTAVAMRDLIFYRWHAHIEDIFQKHKAMLTRYHRTVGEFPLLLPGIHIQSILVQVEDARHTTNVLHTLWASAKYNLNFGLALHSKSEVQKRDEMHLVPVCVKQLNHKPFYYNLTVMYGRTGGRSTDGSAFTVRLYLAPRHNHVGMRYTIHEQHKHFFILDMFRVSVRPGINNIIRRSVDSTLTIQADQHTESANIYDMPEYCGCGWPQHMLLPKGRKGEGMLYDLFVMITHEDSSAVPFLNSTARNKSCEEAFLYCGAMDAIYPDPKPMGYPFDRLPYHGVQYLEDYIHGVHSQYGQNSMATVQVKIVHQDEDEATIL